MKRLAFGLFVLCVSLLAQKPEFWSGAQYDAAIPTVEKVLGFGIGERHATHGDIVRYYEALAAAAPGRMKVFEYGKTWEGRKLIYAAIGSEANLRRLEEIKAGNRKLADPRKTAEAETKSLIASAPVILSLAYGVHGNEISSPDAALMTAYHLLAARNDKLTAEVFQRVVVLLDPLQNPDGRERFIHNFRTSVGLEPDGSPVSAERSEPWPGGRTNHYLFDMNRDWFALTQPETQGRVKYLLEWLPEVHVDLHEMGTESTYFFAPGAPPYNPHLTAAQKEQMNWFGKNNAKWFDQAGYTYFTREVFDEFYPGYGASWPWYYGGMGMTYENASVRGLVAEKRDGSTYTFRDSVRKHFIASISTCEAAAANREKLLRNFYEYNRSAVEEGKSEPVKEYILPRRGDTSAVDKLAGLLVSQGVEVRQATSSFQNGGKEYPGGSYSIVMAQPRKRFLRAVLDAKVDMEPEFLKEQERRRKKQLPDRIYDVTGWSLPMLYNVECVGAAAVSQGQFQVVAGGYTPKGSVSGKAEVAYLTPWGTQAAGRFLTGALRAGLVVISADKAFRQGSVQYPSGTLILMVKQNPPSVHEQVARIAGETGAAVTAVNTSWVDEGVDFGSGNTTLLKKPRVAIVWDSPTSAASAGNLRFVLERQYGYPVTAIRAQNLANAELELFHVIILPDSGFGPGYASVLGGATERLKAWVRGGGVLIGIGGALGYLSSAPVGLLALQQERLAVETPPAGAGGRPAEAAKPTGAGGPSGAGGGAGTQAGPAAGGPVPGKILAKPEDLEKAIQPENAMPDPVAGVLVRAKVDPETWVTAGLPATVHVLVNGRNIFAPLKQDRGVNAIVYAPADELVASGYMWDENRKQLAFKPFVAVQQEGRGSVVGFTSDPGYRGFMDGLNVLLLNAVFRAPAAGGRRGGEEEIQ